eukprot:6486291-Amphidinium_carterae.3
MGQQLLEKSIAQFCESQTSAAQRQGMARAAVLPLTLCWISIQLPCACDWVAPNFLQDVVTGPKGYSHHPLSVLSPLSTKKLGCMPTLMVENSLGNHFWACSRAPKLARILTVCVEHLLKSAALVKYDM